MAFSKIVGYNKKGSDAKGMPKEPAFIFLCCFFFLQQNCVKNEHVTWISFFIIHSSILL